MEGEGFSVVLSDYGATIVELHIEDRDGKREDCVLGFDTAQEYNRDRD